jgi:light-regulated signal transduction histidine kinase (bacteriophytochrome)
MLTSPAFGQADLTNCERELIHLAGSIQPHGVLLTVIESCLEIVQVSANTLPLLGFSIDDLLNQPLHNLGGDIEVCVAKLAASSDMVDPVPLKCFIHKWGKAAEFEGTVHRIAGVLLVEIEPIASQEADCQTLDIDSKTLLEHVNTSIQRFSGLSTIGTLADATVKRFRDLIGYDRVMVYRFDPDGNGKIIAEARDPRLDSLLGHHYPATDIPQRARELYIRNRLRVLVDVHYEPVRLEPLRLPAGGEELDMSMCHLRSMSPLHLQYLKNMGVTATLVMSLVKEGRLWGLIACHHYEPRNLRCSVRSAAALLAEVISTRIAAIESYAHVQAAIQVRRLEQRLIEATSTEGDWRLALFRNPHTLLQPLEATGAALFYEGEIRTTGEVPSTPELRALAKWVSEKHGENLFQCSSVVRANPYLDSLTPTASGVLSVRLSNSGADYLMWFRKEQLLTVTWAGDPTKPVVATNPMELSPRSSFAAWSEIVRGTALPWSSGEVALARAFGSSLIDIILQVNAVRLLIAEHQLAHTRMAVASSNEPVLIADMHCRILFANDAVLKLVKRPLDDRPPLDKLSELLFSEPARVLTILKTVADERQAWRGPLELKLCDGGTLPASVRADVVPARDGSVLGFFLIFGDLTDMQKAVAARVRLEQSLSNHAASFGSAPYPADTVRAESDELVGAILANASLAAMDVADGSMAQSEVSLLEEIDNSTRRATELYAGMRKFMGVG